jgi:hypothetical protein
MFVEISDKGIDGRERELRAVLIDEHVCVAVECHLFVNDDDDDTVEPILAILKANYIISQGN